MNYYPRYPAHYVAKTLHLTMEQDGAYTRLLDWCYLNERPIPHAARYAITRAMSASERKAVDAVLAEFFTRDGDGWENERASDEIAAAQPKIAAARANGRKGGRPRKNQQGKDEKPTGFPEETQSEPTAKAPQSPIDQKQDQQQEQASPSGSRLPAAWVLTDDLRAWAIAKRPDLDPDHEAAMFADYWHAKPGKDGRKSDWPATWRNWIRKAKPARNHDATPVRLSAADRVRAHAIEGELADQRAYPATNGHKNLVGPYG